MVSLQVEDLKGFTAGLFVGELFDEWLIREADIVTFNHFTIDGRIRRGYFSEEEIEEGKIGELSSWNKIKPFCYSLIKGKKLPESFHITLQLSPKQTEIFLNHGNMEIREEQIGGLYLNIRYENHRLSCVTGTSLKIFTLDKQLDFEWDESVRRFFKEKKIAFL